MNHRRRVELSSPKLFFAFWFEGSPSTERRGNVGSGSLGEREDSSAAEGRDLAGVLWWEPELVPLLWSQRTKWRYVVSEGCSIDIAI